MRILILGGGVFLGPHLIDAAIAAGHTVATFTRGRTSVLDDLRVRHIRGDRTSDLPTIAGETWDAVVDTSGYVPHVVEQSARFFASRAGRYVFVSSVSVFDHSVGETTEETSIPPLPAGASRTEWNAETYGPLKALCEAVVRSTFRHRATIVRPGLIVGPLDGTDRFTYWPVRVARGGDLLVPGPPERPVQFVDVRDVAEFIVRCVERGASGDYNVTSPQGAFTMRDVVETSRRVSGSRARFVWADEEFLERHDVQPWVELPLWIPEALGLRGLLNVNVARARAAGLRIRPLEQTVRATLDWATSVGKTLPLAAGLKPERERELLNTLRAGE